MAKGILRITISVESFIMQVHLTPTESRDLLWEPSDYFEVLSGNISFSSRRQFRKFPAENSPLITELQFFFESSTKDWGTQEWTICMDADLPNGPALLVVYRRGAKACAWGIVSMVNRAWSHCMPIDSIDLAKNSTKHKQLDKSQNSALLTTGIVVLVLTVCTGGLGALLLPIFAIVPSTRQKLRDITGLNKNEDGILDIAATARSLMFRLANSADELWAGGKTLAGKL